MIVIEPITPKEEEFCRALVLNGLGPAAAYSASRDASRVANASIHSNTKKIFRRPRVKARIEELRLQKADWSHRYRSSHLRARACARGCTAVPTGAEARSHHTHLEASISGLPWDSCRRLDRTEAVIDTPPRDGART